MNKKDIIRSLKKDTWVHSSTQTLFNPYLYNDRIKIFKDPFEVFFVVPNKYSFRTIELNNNIIVDLYYDILIWYYIKKCKKIEHNDYYRNKDIYKRENNFSKLLD